MKTKRNLALQLLLLGGFCAAAQNSNIFQDDMNTVFQVNRSFVTTGLLKDYGLLMTDIGKFNGTLQTSNYTNRSVWQAVYSSLHFMKFNNNISIATPATVNTTANGYATFNGQPVVNLMVLHYQYEQFKSNALTSNLVYVSNNRIYDTPNRTSTPYEVKTAFAATPSKNDLQGNTHTFLFRSELFFRNVNKAISAIQVDFGNGAGFRSVTMGSPISITYNSDGEKVLVFKITYTDGQVLQSRSRFNVSGTVRACTNCRYGAPPDIIPLPNANFQNPPLADMGAGNAFIFYGGNDRILDRPLIIAEGFDPLNEIGPDVLFTPNFLNVNFTLNGVRQTLGQWLDQNNYDLIYLDYGWGGDAIRRNALLLENLIQWVNQRKAQNGSQERNIVMGVSMGGLVARYALRDMEVRNINHDTRLYISMDSPHLGANVPLGFQAAVRYLSGISLFGISPIDMAPQLRDAVNALNSPAATQMLLYQLAGAGQNIVLNNNARNAFVTEYNNLGMPRQWGIRNITVANGSECGVDQRFQPYTQMLAINDSRDVNYFVNILVSFLQSVVTFNPNRFWEGFITTDSDLRLNMEVRALPNQQAQRIFHFRLSYRKVILGIITRTQDFFNFSFNSTPALLPLDNAPGGAFDITNFGNIPANLSGFGINLPQTRFSFIQTPSALNIGNGTQVIGNVDLARAYSPMVPPPAPRNVPFQNFFTNPVINERHVQMTENNGRWLFTEIQGTPAFFSCNYACGGTPIVPSISGPNTICNTNATFTLNNVPAGNTINWMHSPILNYVSGQGTTNYTVARNASGNGSITATVSGGCGTSPAFSLNIRAGGYSSSDYPVFGPSSVCKNEYVTLYTNDLLGATNYNWFWPSDWSYLSGQGTRTLSLMTNYSSNSGAIGVRVANACDLGGSPGVRYVMVNSCGGYYFSYSPNPASTELSVEVLETAENENSELTIDEIGLLDQSGVEIKKYKVNSKKIVVDVKGLRKGTYYLKVLINKEVFTERIVIE